MTAHIERTVIPANCDPTFTHLNQELIEYPKSINDHTEAIQHRLDTAGLNREIDKSQLQAVRIMLIGSQEDMKRIECGIKLDEWCTD